MTWRPNEYGQACDDDANAKTGFCLKCWEAAADYWVYGCENQYERYLQILEGHER